MPSFDIASTIINTASAYGVDPRLALEVAMRESGLNQSAISPKGAIGIFQLMPGTAGDLGVDPRDAAQNIDGGVRYLSQLIGQFAGDVAAALGAYNWGATHVSETMALYGHDWLSHAPAETQAYVSGILANVGSEYSVGPSFAAPGTGTTTTEAPAGGNTGGFSVTTIVVMVGIALLGLFMWQDS